MLKSRNLVQPEDFSIKEIDEILDLAQQIMANPDKYSISYIILRTIN